MLLKKLAPRSLYARFLLIIIIPMVIVQLVATYVFYERHWSSMSRNMSASLSGEIALIVGALETTQEKDYRDIFLAAKKYMNLDMNFNNSSGIDKHNIIPSEYLEFRTSLRKYLPNNVFTVSKIEETSEINVRIFVNDGILDVKASHKRLANPTTYIFIMWMTGTATILLFVAIMFLRNQVRSIVRLTKAAEKFGKGHDMLDYKPQGAKEIRSAAIAFIEMRERIKRLMNRRTQMLAGVSHDLKTPLTRMKLQLAIIQDKDAVEEMEADILEMEKMLEGYLDFARGDSTEPTKDIMLKDFICDIINRYRNCNAKINYEISENIAIHIKEHSLKRCIVNIIENSLCYADVVTISATIHDENHISIFIEDNGCGIPEKERKNVFQPFYRIDKSRNIETGGVGLGLAIASDIVHRHGGEIKLDESELGGLLVEIILPL